MDLDRNVIINVIIMLLFNLTIISVLIYKGTKNK